jgi:arsenate reductase (glutaredoxin)
VKAGFAFRRIRNNNAVFAPKLQHFRTVLTVLTTQAADFQLTCQLVNPSTSQLTSLIFALMKKMYHLGNCTTCQAIIKETGIDKKGFDMQEIKTEKITPAQLDEMKEKTGSYESLFSRRAMKYKEMGLKDKALTEKDYRQLILDEYTFLKRPVVIVNDKIFVGSEKKTVEALKNSLS